MRMQGKVAVVTGGTQGLGAACARAMAAEGAAGLVTCGRNEAKGAAVAEAITAETGVKVVFQRADLSSPQDCAGVFAAADQAFGRCDVLVNAGATTARGDILTTTPELFDEIFAINVKGPFFMMQEAVKLMLREGTEGAIVNIGSMSGLSGQSFLTPYAASKGALATLTRNIAYSASRNRIRVNALNIGWMESDQEKDLHAAQGHGPEWFAERAAALPFGRLLQPDEVAKAVIFLASDDSGMTTGSVVNFDQTIWGSSDAIPEAPAPLSL